MGGESMLGTVGVAVAAEDVGHFPNGLGHGAQSGMGGVTCFRGRPGLRLGSMVRLSRGWRFDGWFGGDGGVAGGGVDAGVAEHDLDGTGVGAAFE